MKTHPHEDKAANDVQATKAVEPAQAPDAPRSDALGETDLDLVTGGRARRDSEEEYPVQM